MQRAEVDSERLAAAFDARLAALGIVLAPEDRAAAIEGARRLLRAAAGLDADAGEAPR